MFKGKRELPEEFRELQKVYSREKTDEGKLRILREMLELIPARRSEFNKVRSYTTHTIRLIKAKIKRKTKRDEAVRKARLFFKNDFFSIALIGDSDSGKTYLLNSLCGSDYPSTYVPFETKKPVIGVFKHKGVTLRVVEVPSAIKPKHAQILREASLIIVMPESGRFVEFINEFMIETPVKVLKAYPKRKWGFLGLIVVQLKGEGLVVFKGTTLSDLDLKKASVNGKEETGSYILKDGDVIK